MTTSDLRTLLRRESAVLHATLDKGIGHLTDAADYRRYVLGSHAFRASLEPALSNAEAATGWQPLLLEAELYGDLAALGLCAMTPLVALLIQSPQFMTAAPRAIPCAPGCGGSRARCSQNADLSSGT